MILRLLTELDAILDTRLGTVDALDGDAAVRLFSNPAYYTRDTDDMEALCGIPQAIYAEAWNRRDRTTLQHSRNVPVIDLIHYGLVQVERRSISDPTLGGALLEVNTYPYQLTPEETNAFAYAIARCAGLNAGIRMIHEPWENFSVARCRTDYAGMILYNHRDWFQHHWRDLIRVGMPQITLVAPKLYPERALSDTELTIEGIGKIDPWAQGAIPMIEYVGLEFIDVQHYCIAHPKAPL